MEEESILERNAQRRCNSLTGEHLQYQFYKDMVDEAIFKKHGIELGLRIIAKANELESKYPNLTWEMLIIKAENRVLAKRSDAWLNSWRNN